MAISFNEIPSNLVASKTAVEVRYKKGGVPSPIPQHVLLLGNFNVDKSMEIHKAISVTSAREVKDIAGPGSMLHRMALHFFESVGAGIVKCSIMACAHGTGASTISIVATGSQTKAGTLSLYVSGDVVKVAVDASMVPSAIHTAIANAINANTDLPVTAVGAAGGCTVTAKFVSLPANEITIAQNLVYGDSLASPPGLTITITHNGGASVNPNITDAVAALGSEWYNFVVCPYDDLSTLNTLVVGADLRWQALFGKPFVAIVGHAGTRDNFKTVLANVDNRSVCYIPVEKSNTAPFEIAASAAGAFAVSAQADPSMSLRTLPLKRVRPSPLAPWTFAQMDEIEKLGGSVTYTDAAGVVRIYDALTTYTKNASGEDDDGYRYVETCLNIQAKIYSLNQLMNKPEYQRGSVVDDDSPTTKTTAIAPKKLKADIIKLIDEQWIAEAWSKNRASIIDGLDVKINGSNAGRLDIYIPDVMVCGLRIMAMVLEFSFFGTAA